MKSISTTRKIFSVVLAALLLHSFLGNVLTAQLILAVSDHSHVAESSFDSDGIQVRLMHGHTEPQVESHPHHASESLHSEMAADQAANHIEGTTHSDHEIDLTLQDSEFLLVKTDCEIPYSNLMQIAQAHLPLFLPPTPTFFKLPEKRNKPLHTRIRSVVILV